MIVKKAKNGRYYQVPKTGGPAKWLSAEEGARLWRAQRAKATKKAVAKKAVTKKAEGSPRRRRPRYITD